MDVATRAKRHKETENSTLQQNNRHTEVLFLHSILYGQGSRDKRPFPSPNRQGTALHWDDG